MSIKHEHVTAQPYIIGFLLSLIFTLIPYFLVVQKHSGRTIILVTILVFAVLQMAIQLLFFLHLGREQKPRWNTVFLVNTLSIITLVVVASVWIMSHLTHNIIGMDATNRVSSSEAIYQIAGGKAGTCPAGTGANYKIELGASAAVPSHVTTHQCDTLMFVNSGTITRQINFGVRDQYLTYGGGIGGSIRPGHNLQITLTELGTYEFHDPLHSGISGDFTVKP